MGTDPGSAAHGAARMLLARNDPLKDAEAAGSHNPEPHTYHARRVVFADFVEL